MSRVERLLTSYAALCETSPSSAVNRFWGKDFKVSLRVPQFYLRGEKGLKGLRVIKIVSSVVCF